MKVLKLKARMMPANRMADGSVTLKLRTDEEIDSKDFAHIDSYRQHDGWVMFRANDFSAADIPTDDTNVESRSPSEVLRMSLFKLFMMQGGKRENFSPWYREQMGHFQRVIGDKIEALESKSNGTSRKT